MVPYEAERADVYETAEQLKVRQDQRHADLEQMLAAARARVATKRPT